MFSRWRPCSSCSSKKAQQPKQPAPKTTPSREILFPENAERKPVPALQQAEGARRKDNIAHVPNLATETMSHMYVLIHGDRFAYGDPTKTAGLSRGRAVVLLLSTLIYDFGAISVLTTPTSDALMAKAFPPWPVLALVDCLTMTVFFLPRVLWVCFFVLDIIFTSPFMELTYGV